mgnify:CR=1 FL=1
MNLDKLTLKSQELFQKAHTIAVEKGQQAIEPIHFLGALLADDQGIAVHIIPRPQQTIQPIKQQRQHKKTCSDGQQEQKCDQAYSHSADAPNHDRV